MDAGEIISAVEKHARRPIKYRADVVFLMETADATGMGEVLADAIFQAKFLTKTEEVLKRIGHGAEGYDALSAQFAESLEKTSTLLRTLVKESPAAKRDPFVDQFLAIRQDVLPRLLDLLRDLTLFKNWEVDGNLIPVRGYPSPRAGKPAADGATTQAPQMVRLIRLAIVLLLLLFVIDGPFTILGWITAAVIVGILVALHVEASRAESPKND